MKILLLNAGSSSLKATLMDATDGTTIASCQADWAGQQSRYRFTGSDGQEHSADVAWRGHAETVRQMVRDLQQIEPIALRNSEALLAVGHRIVHGGEFTSAIRITPEVRARIDALVDLAPLHNPPSMKALAAAEAAFPNVTHVAVFDTTFHLSMPAQAFTYAIPHQWTQDWGIRKYGFHGLSHAYCTRRAPELLKRPVADLRLVICHLGHGCSASAVAGGRCVDNTMGFTPLDGLMMATRCGTIDPSIVLYVQQRHGLTPADVESALNRESGLKGVSQVSADLREVIAAANAGHPAAQLAREIYTLRIRQFIGSLTVTMGGIDALVFTAGVGEHSAEIRADVCRGLECLGLELDQDANLSCHPDVDIASANSKVRVLVIATQENSTMFDEVCKVMQTSASQNGTS